MMQLLEIASATTDERTPSMTQDADPTPRLNPDDFEAGEDVTDEVAVSPTPGIQLAVRLSLEEAAQLQVIARKEGKSLTEVTRASLLVTIATGAVPAAPRP